MEASRSLCRAGTGNGRVRLVDEALDVFELSRNARQAAAAARQRALETCQVSEEIVADSLAIVEVSKGLRDGAFTSRCAWCGRYRIGDRWVTVGRPEVVLESRTTHSVCDDCTTALRDAGQSV